MKTTVLLLMALCATAHAQITTLDYQGALMSGSSTSLNPGQQWNQPLPRSPFSFAVTADLTVRGSLGSGDLTLVSYDINGIQSRVSSASDGFSALGPGQYLLDHIGTLTLVTTDGAVTGAAFNINEDFYHVPHFSVSVGPTGDSASYRYGTVQGGCENLVPFMSVYNGGSMLCDASAASATAGVWTKVNPAPELDPASAAGGLTLLMGSLMVFRGRRAKPMPARLH